MINLECSYATCLHLIHELAEYLCLEAGSLDAAHQEAWWLLEHVMMQPPSTLLMLQPLIMSDDQRSHLLQVMVERVEEHKPLQYILGSVQFCNLSIKVRPPILIPRPETEEWALWLIDQIWRQASSLPSLSLLDLCTGSGCIALALARAFPSFKVVGVDISSDAIALAQENKKDCGIENCTFLQGSLYDPLPQDMVFDMIIANPPYLSPDKFAELAPSVRNWEDPRALVAQDQGMAIYKAIIQEAKRYIRSAESTHFLGNLPKIIFEIGQDQQLPLLEVLCAQYGWKGFTVYTDLAGKPRWVTVSHYAE